MLDRVISVTEDMTKPYTAFESWVYDRAIAPAVLDMAAAAARELAEGIEATGKLLDVGCGGGQLLAWMAESYPRLQLTGIDLSTEQIGRAKKRMAAHAGRVDLRVGSALALPFDDGTFEAVISVASIKHWPHPMQGMREIQRVLRPGGMFFVAEADRGCKLDDARKFVDGWLLPGPLKRLALPLFRTFVAGVGLDLDDARQILRDLGQLESGARRLPGKPGILLTGSK